MFLVLLYMFIIFQNKNYSSKRSCKRLLLKRGHGINKINGGRRKGQSIVQLKEQTD